ncbi:GumC family protein [Ferruginibacter sp.]
MLQVENNNNKYVEKEEQDSNMGQQLISKFVPYWPLLILFVLLALSGAYVYLRYVTPMYEAGAKIIIKGAKGAEPTKSDAMQSMMIIAANKEVENEIEVLTSRAMMENVVKQLSLYAPVSQMGQVKKGDAYLVSPITIELRNPDSLIEVEKVDFTYDKNTQTVTLENKDRYKVGEYVNTAYGVLRFMPNKYYRPFLESKRQLSFALQDPREVAVGYLRGLKVTGGQQSALVDLTFRDALPQRAVDILNSLISIYEEKSVDEKKVLSRNTLAFINENMAILKKDIDSIEQNIKVFRANNDAVNISGQGQEWLTQVASTGQEAGKVSNKLAVLNQVEKSVNSRSGDDAIMPSVLGVEDPALSGLMDKYYSAKLEYDKLSKTVGAANPILLAKGEELKKMKPAILDNIHNQKLNLEVTQSSLYSQMGTAKAKLNSVPGKEKALLEISREYQTKNDQYTSLAVKKQEAELTITSVESSSRTVDTALANKQPVSPKKKMIYMMALAAACGLFAGTIILKDVFTGKVKYRAEIEKMTSLPIIGEIAFEKTKSPIVIEKGTRSFVAEEFRKLRISLSFLGIDNAHKKLLLTSSISGEGKSFIAANLAVSLSLTGKKVVLVDLDLNNPTLSKMFNVDYEDGSTEYLTGEKTAAEIINKLDSYENLHFISAGSLPENPTELLANGRVKSLIDYLESNYDMVVIDTSPAVLVTDAYILSGMCDATLYVVRHDYTPKMLIRRIDENNQINPIHNPAIVFNGVKTRGVFKNNYGYGYDYVYGNKDRGGKTKKAS